jgi:alpha-beta hydrolase superfamily lysophospholipase
MDGACAADREIAVKLGLAAAILLLGAGLGGAGAARAEAPAALVPEILNTTAVYSKACSEIIYSSNKTNLYRPYSLKLGAGPPAQPVEIALRPAHDYLARSLSYDCRWIAAVSDLDERGRFKVFLIEKGQDTPVEVSLAPGSRVDEGEPELSPAAPLLAFLSRGRLALHDYAERRFLDVPRAPVRFTELLWSGDGKSLILVDSATSLWRFTLADRSYQRLWRAPKPSFAPRMPWTDGVELLFVSDHDSPFNQIYSLDLASGRVSEVHRSEADKFSPRRLPGGDLVYRESQGNSYAVWSLPRGAGPGAKPRRLSPALGVAYDYSFDFGAPVLMFSDDAHVTSLYRAEPGGALAPLLPVTATLPQAPARLVASGAGVNHLLYLPPGAGKPPAGIVVWLHGGPHEDVSPRYNVYFAGLLGLGYGVYALNYPGSTGAGNDYELRGASPPQARERQVEAVEREVARLAELGLADVPLVFVAVSYGSLVAHDVVLGGRVHPARLVDLSGISGAALASDYAAASPPFPKLLFIYGSRDPFLAVSGRRKLFEACESKLGATRVEIPDEGHYIKKRASLEQVLAALRAFLAPR